MPGWGWALLGALAACAVVFLVMYIVEKLRKPVEVDRSKIEASLRAEYEAKLKIEIEKTAKLAQLAEDQKKRLADLDAWYAEQKGKIDADKQAVFEKFRTDTDAAGAELDRILGIGAADGGSTTDSGARPT